MKKFSKILMIFVLVLSLSLLASCKKKQQNDNPDNPFGEGIEGPIVDY